jgi:hypothetical protein
LITESVRAAVRPAVEIPPASSGRPRCTDRVQRNRRKSTELAIYTFVTIFFACDSFADWRVRNDEFGWVGEDGRERAYD